uniref:protein-tyrosine sulfotransferase n=1 Tax=Tetraselmis sp. GSL018 TaxID=582737 RepID=A0A061RHA9_9CHLO|eukprot:CAMPEP_0177585992 /NCGR_PEP_ID=MMETSP0419_2-20121207/4816_1 /TAXON_ID=582737 /ORGANISM="Tetraselmis sp., Strain GSL018" /LENGTH=567 /DNA_ID=CAMNT_0019075817 /DNA_START=49 /DNA_END=1755 /DNA_ORIENTATION=+
MSRKIGSQLRMDHLKLLFLLAFMCTELLYGQMAQVDRNDIDSEILNLRKASLENPWDAFTWLKLAVTLQEADHRFPDGGTRVEEALSAYKEALGSGLPEEGHVTVYGNMGALLMGYGETKQAIEALDTGLDTAERLGVAASQTGGLLYNRGKALTQLGEMDRAAESFLAAMDAARRHDPHIFTLAAVSLKHWDDSLLTEIEGVASFLQGESKQQSPDGRPEELSWVSGISQEDRGYLHMGLYKAYADRGDLDRAWEHLHRGNAEYRRAIGGPDARADSQLLSVLRSVFRGGLNGPGGHKDKTPIFIVGIPRSGSTLIEQILASHSKVWGAGEDTAMAPIVGKLVSETGGMTTTADPKRLAEYGRLYVEEMRRKVPKESSSPARIVDKMLRNLWNVGHIHLLLPDACIIHAVRHPLDTAVSCYEQPFEGRGTPWAWDWGEIGDYILHCHAVAQHWDKALPGRVLKVHYEELVANQENVTRRILRHCGLEFEPEVLEFYKLKRGVQTASVSQVRQKMYNSSVFKYKKVEKHIQPIIKKLGSLAAAYEQELDAAISRSGKQKGETAKDEL